MITVRLLKLIQIILDKRMKYLICLLLLSSCGPGPIEDELLQVCWDNGRAIYSGCNSTESLIWPASNMPLRYWIDPGLDRFGESIDGAAEIWNDETCPLLFAARSVDSANVKITEGAEYGLTESIDDRVVASVMHYGFTHVATSVMVFNDWTDIHTFLHWAVHEFGHVLGLAHSSSGIMRSMLPAHLDEITPALPSDSDIMMIKQLYCGE